MWKVHPDIRIEGPLLTCESENRGAKHLKQFSAEFPHFEVSSNTQVDSSDALCKVRNWSKHKH